MMEKGIPSITVGVGIRSHSLEMFYCFIVASRVMVRVVRIRIIIKNNNKMPKNNNEINNKYNGQK